MYTYIMYLIIRKLYNFTIQHVLLKGPCMRPLSSLRSEEHNIQTIVSQNRFHAATSRVYKQCVFKKSRQKTNDSSSCLIVARPRRSHVFLQARAGCPGRATAGRYTSVRRRRRRVTRNGGSAVRVVRSPRSVSPPVSAVRSVDALTTTTTTFQRARTVAGDARDDDETRERLYARFCADVVTDEVYSMVVINEIARRVLLLPFSTRLFSRYFAQTVEQCVRDIVVASRIGRARRKPLTVSHIFFSTYAGADGFFEIDTCSCSYRFYVCRKSRQSVTVEVRVCQHILRLDVWWQSIDLVDRVNTRDTVSRTSPNVFRSVRSFDLIPDDDTDKNLCLVYFGG